MPTPSGVNHQLPSCSSFEKFCRFLRTRFSGRFNVFLFSFCLCYVTIGGLFLGFYIYLLPLENRFYGFVNYLIEIFILDGAESSVNVPFNISGYNLAFHETGLCKRVTNQHLV